MMYILRASFKTGDLVADPKVETSNCYSSDSYYLGSKQAFEITLHADRGRFDVAVHGDCRRYRMMTYHHNGWIYLHVRDCVEPKIGAVRFQYHEMHDVKEKMDWEVDFHDFDMVPLSSISARWDYAMQRTRYVREDDVLLFMNGGLKAVLDDRLDGLRDSLFEMQLPTAARQDELKPKKGTDGTDRD